MTTTTFSRTVDGRELPLPGAYSIDAIHSSVGFQIQHMGISKVRGRFTDFSGTVTIGETPAASSVAAVIQAGSIDTAQAQRDAHLRSTDFFGVENHPTLEFRSTDIAAEDGSWTLRGELTMCGVTRPVVLDLEFTGAGPDAMGDHDQPRVGFCATTTIDREEFGITFNQVLETGGWLLSKKVRIDLDIEAARQ